VTDGSGESRGYAIDFSLIAALAAQATPPFQLPTGEGEYGYGGLPALSSFSPLPD
jgi:hypothetical protein